MTELAPRGPVRRDIQALRALAVIGVVLAHVTGWPSGGFVGVDVFFVVSGFLITGALLREIAATGRVSLVDFFARRIRRILPAALIVLVAVVAVGFVVFNTARAERTLGDAVAAALLVSNWRFAIEGTDYFTMGEALSPLQHFWSLSVEEQFYLVWPVLVLLAVLLVPTARRRRGGRGAVALVAAVVFVASAAWAWMQTPADPTVAYFSTATRAWELAAGALLAVAAPWLARLPGLVRGVLGWVGIAGVVWSFFAIDPSSPFPAPWAALPVAAAALVIAGGVGGDPRQRHLLPVTNPIAVFVGDMSYSLYLWHFPVVVFAAVLLPVGTASTVVVMIVIAALSLASYLGVEQPLRHAPWLRRRGTDDVPGGEPEPAASAPAARASAPVLRTAPVAGSSRPAGWAPGTRYYPGSARRPAEVEVPAAPPREIEAVAESPAVATAEPPVAESPVLADAEPSTSGPSSWSRWRARYAPRMGLAATTLVLGSGAVVLALMVGFGAPVLGPLTPPVAVATDQVVGDPGAEAQAEIVQALAATPWPNLSPSLDRAIATSSSDNPARDCFTPGRPLDAAACTWGSPTAARHMYLVGDSTAMAYAPAFKRIAEDSGGAWRITTVGLYGCRFTDVLVENDGAGVMAACPQRKADVRAQVAADPADLVVVSNAYTLGRTSDGRDLDAMTLQRSTQAEVSSYGATAGVVYLAPPPHGADLGRCYSPLTSPAACASAVEPTWNEMQSAAEAVAAGGGGFAVSSLPFSCADGVCPAFAGTLPVRYDENHLTVAYAEHIAPVLRAALISLGVY